MLLCFFLYYVGVIKPHAALEVEGEPYLRSSCASLFMLLWSAKKSLEFYHPYSYNREKRARHRKKKKKGWDTLIQQKCLGDRVMKLGIWIVSCISGKWGVTPPCPLLAFISFFINRGLGMLTCSVATLLAINTFADTLFIAFICKYGPLQTGCDNYTE